jgi:hypothetical protein
LVPMINFMKGNLQKQEKIGPLNNMLGSRAYLRHCIDQSALALLKTDFFQRRLARLYPRMMP